MIYFTNKEVYHTTLKGVDISTKSFNSHFCVDPHHAENGNSNAFKTLINIVLWYGFCLFIKTIHISFIINIDMYIIRKNIFVTYVLHVFGSSLVTSKQY